MRLGPNVTNYIDIFLVFFDHLPSYFDIFYLINLDKKSTFWTTYPPLLFNIVCECPLTSYVFHWILTSVKDGLKLFLQVLQQSIHSQAFIPSNLFPMSLWWELFPMPFNRAKWGPPIFVTSKLCKARRMVKPKRASCSDEIQLALVKLGGRHGRGCCYCCNCCCCRCCCRHTDRI